MKNKKARHCFMSHFFRLNNAYPANNDFRIFMARPHINLVPIESGQNSACNYENYSQHTAAYIQIGSVPASCAYDIHTSIQIVQFRYTSWDSDRLADSPQILCSQPRHPRVLLQQPRMVQSRQAFRLSLPRQLLVQRGSRWVCPFCF